MKLRALLRSVLHVRITKIIVVVSLLLIISIIIVIKKRNYQQYKYSKKL